MDDGLPDAEHDGNVVSLSRPVAPEGLRLLTAALALPLSRCVATATRVRTGSSWGPPSSRPRDCRGAGEVTTHPCALSPPGTKLVRPSPGSERGICRQVALVIPCSASSEPGCPSTPPAPCAGRRGTNDTLLEYERTPRGAPPEMYVQSQRPRAASRARFVRLGVSRWPSRQPHAAPPETRRLEFSLSSRSEERRVG